MSPARRYPERRGCLGWPEVGSCEEPAQTSRDHRRGRWSASYCRSCDEARLLNSGAYVGEDEDEQTEEVD